MSELTLATIYQKCVVPECGFLVGLAVQLSIEFESIAPGCFYPLRPDCVLRGSRGFSLHIFWPLICLTRSPEIRTALKSRLRQVGFAFHIDAQIAPDLVELLPLFPFSCQQKTGHHIAGAWHADGTIETITPVTRRGRKTDFAIHICPGIRRNGDRPFQPR